MTIGKLSATLDSSPVPSATFSARTFRKMHEQLCKVSQTRVAKSGRERGETRLAKLWDSGLVWFSSSRTTRGTRGGRTGRDVVEAAARRVQGPASESSIGSSTTTTTKRNVSLHDRVTSCYSVCPLSDTWPLWKYAFRMRGDLVRCIIDRLTCWQGRMELTRHWHSSMMSVYL